MSSISVEDIFDPAIGWGQDRLIITVIIGNLRTLNCEGSGLVHPESQNPRHAASVSLWVIFPLWPCVTVHCPQNGKATLNQGYFTETPSCYSAWE
ncbi:MAG: hypothetical protein MZV63_27170 [Marinilabiliales bacterium]|nr:hypothetical protein [Marinilabiliales bacterium]